MVCAGLRAVLGLRITTHQQLARVVVNAGDALDTMWVGQKCEAEVSQLAWTLLRDLYSSSGSSSRSGSRAPWPPDGMRTCKMLSMLLFNLMSCIEVSVLPSRYHMYAHLRRTELTQGGETTLDDLLTTSNPKSSSNNSSTATGTVPTSSSSSSGPATATAPTGSSNRQPAGEAGNAAGSSSSTAYSSCGGSSSSDGGGSDGGRTAGSPLPQSQSIDMELPLDDCALLLQYSSNLGPVLRGIAEWVATGLKDTTYTGLESSLYQYLMAQVYAASSTCSSRVVSDGPRRRTLLPRFTEPNYTLSPAKLGHYLDCQLIFMYHRQGKLPQQARVKLANLVAHEARDVAQELGLEDDSPAATALTHAAVYAGACCRHLIVQCFSQGMAALVLGAGWGALQRINAAILCM
jgi:hypothetical protein